MPFSFISIVWLGTRCVELAGRVRNQLLFVALGIRCDADAQVVPDLNTAETILPTGRAQHRPPFSDRRFQHQQLAIQGDAVVLHDQFGLGSTRSLSRRAMKPVIHLIGSVRGAF
ncbi:hypothetical protein WL57_37340 [Burkholderia cepacia]|nr:hypothetical protein WL57_37340 [Burkholderia cepacia]